MQQSSEVSLPITIIGGYLGAGKTTLVNHLLRNADGIRLAILVNEFGELPIDEDLIEAQDDDIISIAGGCVCCSYGNDLTLAMMDLVNMSPPPDHVLLEASGVALPGAIASSVSLINGYNLDGVIVLVDAETIRDQANDTYVGDTITRQINDADLIVVNKSDLPSDQELFNTESWLKDLSSNAEILSTSHGVLPPETLLQSFLGRAQEDQNQQHHQANIFETSSFVVERSVNAEKLAQELAKAELVRAKGFVNDISGEKISIQVVGKRWSISPAPNNVSTGLVAIGFRESFNSEIIRNLIDT